LRGYSGKATKWVDFVMTDSTRRESCHSLKVTAKRIGVKGHLWIIPGNHTPGVSTHHAGFARCVAQQR
jgi:hypothetical protein